MIALSKDIINILGIKKLQLSLKMIVNDNKLGIYLHIDVCFHINNVLCSWQYDFREAEIIVATKQIRQNLLQKN